MVAQPNAIPAELSLPATLVEAAPAPKPEPKPKKKLVKRLQPDRSQTTRRWVQFAFLVLNLWIGTQFVLFVHYFESAGRTVEVSRPAGVEGWLPIAALMNWKVFFFTGEIPTLHPAGMFLLGAFFVISFVFRKAFCSWLCPVGTVSEYLWKLGRKLFRKNYQIPGLFDVPLRGLKYILLGLFLYAVGSMPVIGIKAFLEGPYGVIADVKMLNFFRFLTTTGLVTIAVLVVLSVFIQNFWCRYLCPYGALMGFASMLSPLRIRRNPDPCIDCAKCAKACPSALPVDKLITIKSAECTACMECVAVCPAEGALALSLPNIVAQNLSPKKRTVPAWAVAAGVAIIFLGVVSGAKVAGYWDTEIPREVYMQLVPRAHEFGHP